VNSPRVSLRWRLGALGVALLLIGLTAWWATNSPESHETFPAFPAVQAHPPTAKAAPARSPRGPQPSSVVPVRYGPPRQPQEPGSQRSERPTPASSPSPIASPGPLPSTNCHNTGSGGLACTGGEGSFTCATNAAGASRCSGTAVSFTCSTDPRTGRRACDGSPGTWDCLTNAETGNTSCGGSGGSFWCQHIPGQTADRQCSGSHTFWCYDQANGRNCGGSAPSDPDCFLEPIFGAFCRP
jgi:hypothetical protein